MSMKETMDRELAEAIATLERANSALSRIFNTEEREGECESCEPLCGDHLTTIRECGCKI